MIKILISEPAHKSLQIKLEEAGFFCEQITNLSFDELKEIIGNYQGLVIRSKYKIDKNFLDQTKGLKFIARAGSGLENINIDYAEKLGILCLNSPEGNRDSVGEHTLGLILSVLHKIRHSSNEVNNGIWDRKSNVGTELNKKTVGILGYGNMGSAFAKRLHGFNTNVIAYDKYKTQYSDNYVREVDLKTFFEETEILSIHVPLTEETNFMINTNYINKFKRNIYIINTARGKILRTADLAEGLKSKKISGAALDVLEYEKANFDSIKKEDYSEDLNYLLNAENVIITPHIAGSSVESYKKTAEVLAQKIISHFKVDTA